MPISATMYVGWPSPTHRLPIRTSRVMMVLRLPSAKQNLTQLPYGAAAARPGEDQIGGLQNLGGGVGHRHTARDQGEARQVIYVVAEVDGLLGGDAAVRQGRPQRRRFVGD